MVIRQTQRPPHTYIMPNMRIFLTSIKHISRARDIIYLIAAERRSQSFASTRVDAHQGIAGPSDENVHKNKLEGEDHDCASAFTHLHCSGRSPLNVLRVICRLCADPIASGLFGRRS
jgi:hypothetical protein